MVARRASLSGSRTAFLIFAALLSAGIGYLTANAIDPDGPPSLVAAPFHGTIELAGNGVGPVRFGTSQALATPGLKFMFGGPTKSTTVASSCAVTGSMSWRNVMVVFERGRFVGYRIGSAMGKVGSFPDVRTAEGLRLGDTISEARQIYGQAFTTSAGQGGSWSTETSSGRLYGLLIGPPQPVGPSDQIEEISAGSLGCA